MFVNRLTIFTRTVVCACIQASISIGYLPLLVRLFFQYFLYPSDLAIFQLHFDTPVMFGSTCQNTLNHPFCQHTGSLVFF